MPAHSQTITVAGADSQQLKSLSYAALKKLGWNIKYAAGNSIIAFTPQTWKRYANEIHVAAEDGQIAVSSKMIHGELFDISGRTKKDVAEFIRVFEEVRASQTDISGIQEKLHSLEQETVQQAETEIKQAQEMDKVMNLSKGNMYLTYAIIGINILVFVFMAFDGAGIFEPNSLVHVKWGSNFSFYTLTGDWWRIITNVFLHFGIIHLLMNMYALFMVGVYLEPMLGKPRFAAAYIACGMLASVASLWWHKEGVNSAGASGAIFGMYGLFLALLTSKLIPEAARKALLQSTTVFVAYNLFYGLKGGVDNAAHIGGLVSGFIFGQLYIVSLRKERREMPPQKWMAPVILVAAITISWLYIQQNKLPVSDRKEIKAELDREKYSDSKLFNEKLAHFDEVHARALSVYDHDGITDLQLKDSIELISLPSLDAAEKDLIDAGSLRLSPADVKKREKLLEYVAVRQKEFRLILEMISSGESNSGKMELQNLREKAVKLFNEAVGK